MQKTSNLDSLRHSCAHLLAAAVSELFPHTKLTIGPAIENGFYYDFDFDNAKIREKGETHVLRSQISLREKNTRISEEDLPRIEKKMEELLPFWKRFEQRVVTEEEARKIYKNNPYKLELIDEILKRGEKITLYKSGGFEDLCRGGHCQNPAEEITAFKLLSIAGAYWRGSEKNPMLTRIYGTCFPTKKELNEYLKQLEEAKKRDHRKLGKDLDIFILDPLVGPGLPLWLPNGTIIKEDVEKFAKETEQKYGYRRISTPHVAKKELFETSGHLPYYKDSMYPPMKLDDGDYYLKAMNCPMTHLIFRNTPKSYRDLPLRLAEYGTVYRHELSGTLAGLLRVRGMTQNDAHIYCTKEQIKDEFKKVMELHEYYYKIFGIKDYYMRLSLHDSTKKEKYIDEPQLWQFSERVIKEAMEESGLPYVEAVGEAAFYGPKIDFQIKSVIGREESASTNQLDFAASKRFNLYYIDKDGKEKPVFVIHRAPLGSHERFIAFLIEHYAGAFPLWLSPIQVVVIPIADRHVEYASSIVRTIELQGVRVQLDSRQETVSSKIRDATLQKAPYMGIIGDKEVQSFDKFRIDPERSRMDQSSKLKVQSYEESVVSVRTREGKDLGQIALSKFLNKLKEEIDKKI